MKKVFIILFSSVLLFSCGKAHENENFTSEMAKAESPAALRDEEMDLMETKTLIKDDALAVP